MSNNLSSDEAKQLLKEILVWSRFQNFPKLRKLLIDTLDSDIKKLAYELTDGEKSRYDIAKELNISDGAVRSWWEVWYNLGILQPSGKRKGRPQKLMSLEDMGIEFPKIQVQKSKTDELSATDSSQKTLDLKIEKK